MIALLLTLALAPPAALAAVSAPADDAELPAVSPSIEHDAEYLLTTTDFDAPQLGMTVEDVDVHHDSLVVRTTGAEFIFEPGASRLRLRQRLGMRRESAVVNFAAGSLEGLAVERRAPGVVMLAARGGDFVARINGDSLLMMRDARGLSLGFELAFAPLSAHETGGDFLLMDEYGALGCFHASTGPLAFETSIEDAVTATAGPDEILWLSVGPPRPFPWQQSLRDRVCWHWSMETGYPTDDQIREWSRRGNILLQQSEVMLWKDWSLRFIPRDGLGEFKRVNRTCEALGMRNIVYTSPLYFLMGTGLEAQAMNSFEHFAETGFSPGDLRGLNWPIFIHEIAKVMAEYKPDGLYFDGIYGNVVRTYIVARKARQIVGEDGLLEFHATYTPPGGGVYLPQIDTYFDFILRGEGCEAQYTNADYLRYFVSTYNISNSIGVLCNNNNYPLDADFVATLLDDNIRLHYLPSDPTNERTEGMIANYWPNVNQGLRKRVERATARRQAEWGHVLERLARARRAAAEALPVLYAADLSDAGFAASVAPGKGAFELPDGWSGYLSPHSEGKLTPGADGLRIDAHAHTVAYLQRDLPAGTVAAECRIRATGDCGMSWGPGLMLWVGDRPHRIGLRSDGKAQVDRAGTQMLYDDVPVGEWVRLRIRVAEGCMLYELAVGDGPWRCLHVDFVGDLEGAMSMAVGKIPYGGSQDEYREMGGMGECEISDVRAYGPAEADR
jgi:hypothetical protein